MTPYIQIDFVPCFEPVACLVDSSGVNCVQGIIARVSDIVPHFMTPYIQIDLVPCFGTRPLSS